MVTNSIVPNPRLAELNGLHPGVVDYRLVTTEASRVPPDAVFNGLPRNIGHVAGIGAECSFDYGVELGDDVRLGNQVSVGADTRLRDGVSIGDRFTIGRNVVMMEGSGVIDATRQVNYAYARQILDCTVVGPGVQLPSEVQVGPNAIIPTADTIRTIGFFGTNQHAMTIYGGPNGPRFSAIHLTSLTNEQLLDYIASKRSEEDPTAQGYASHLDTFWQVAESVQTAYMQQTGLASELLRIHSEL